jgi:hypothetical protein
MSVDDLILENAIGGDPGYAIAYALLKLAEAQQSLATHVKYLGNGNAAPTPQPRKSGETI